MAEWSWTRPGREVALIGGLALLVTAVYVGSLLVSGDAGFPLDDSWIHQTYARNLVEAGQWAFAPGESSAGSTSPLWTVLLAGGYLLGAPHLAWTYLLGALCLAWTGWAMRSLCRGLWPKKERLANVAAVVTVTNWPLVWAAGSGMETLLFVALSVQLMATLSQGSGQGQRGAVILGILGGLLVLTRPEGLLLLALGLVGSVVVAEGGRQRVMVALGNSLAAALVVAPYFIFNWLVSGAPFPNTFYAKQAEYALLWQRPLLLRFGQLLVFSLGGPEEGLRGMSAAHVLLVPGLLASLWPALKADASHRRLRQALPLLWAGGLVLVYAWRLPVTYQHGRYLMPAIPVWILYGLAGWEPIRDWMLDRLGRAQRAVFLWRGVASLTLAVMLLLFLALGLGVYRQNVAFINGEMVAVGRWLAANTPEDALIAAHDIGAIGYFARRPLLDLAGLVSPEVVPLLADEDALAEYVIDRKADFLVTAPGWTYPALTKSQRAASVYETGYAWTSAQGFNNMVVYRLADP